VRLGSGHALAYDQLVLATGARPRRLPGLAEGLRNVVLLRSAEDAQRLRLQLAQAERVVVIGGGFIGLELAATARALGKTVTVLEAAPRLLARAVSPELSDHVLQTHRAAGIEIRVDVPAMSTVTEGDRATAVKIGDETLPLDLLVIGIGATPEIALAQSAGLDCANGVVVDAHMRTSDPAIFAIGDCASFPYAPWGEPLRLESVQNAHDQARTLAATLMDRAQPYTAVPWFWSEQGTMRLQMTGLARPQARRVRRPGATPQSFSVLHYDGDRLVCVESVNAPMDHIAAKKILELGRSPAPDIAVDPAIPLKTHAV
jgi:3-phenylpropionate/trans-cinnamate dioxygenase ferredoxin reductase subunit